MRREERYLWEGEEGNKNAIWNFFLMSGYLRYDNYSLGIDNDDTSADLSIPNREILVLFKNKIVPNWFTSRPHTDDLINMAQHLVSGDIDVFKKEFTEYCLNSFSYYDVSGDHPEKFYHGFVLGMFNCLKDKYQIRSNRESGYGRYDILLIPKSPPLASLHGGDKSDTPPYPPHLLRCMGGAKGRGIIFEFKLLDEKHGETFEKAIERGKRQLIEKKYYQELQAQGIDDIVSLVAVFKGKEVRVD